MENKTLIVLIIGITLTIILISACIEKPVEEILLPAHCTDGIYNEGEEGLDCGWSCPNECDFTEKQGILKENETWSGNILVVDPHVIVPEGITLTIGPGTVVKFAYCQNNYKRLCEASTLSVNGGKLYAVGTPEKQIWFTSAAKEPMNGDWAGISFFNSKDSEIGYAIVEFTPIGILLFDSSSITIHDSIIRWANVEGIYMERSSALIENNTIYENAYHAIGMEQFNYDVIIRNNRIIDGHDAVNCMESQATLENNLLENNVLAVNINTSANLTVKNNKIIDNEWALASSEKAKAEITGNEIRNNEDGMNICLDCEMTFNSNAICDNGEYDVRIPNPEISDLTNNWWCTTYKEEITQRIDSLDFDDVYHPVTLDPVLTSDPTDIIIPEFAYPDLKNFELGYIPGDKEDKFLYVFPDDETRKIVKRTGAGLGFDFSLEYADGFLWRGSGSITGKIMKVDADTGEVVKSVEVPDIQRLAGLAFDGESLWAGCFVTKKVFQVNPNTGEVISSFDLPMDMEKGIAGMVWDGEYLYLSEWIDSKLYKVDKEGNLLEILPIDFGGRGITWDGKHFWVSGCVGAKKGICKLNKKGELLGEIYSPAHGTSALAWQPADNEYGGFLWSISTTSEFWIDDPKMSKMEILNDSLEEPERRRCRLRSMLFACPAYNVSRDKIVIELENKGIKGLTIDSFDFYFEDESIPDCPAKNLNLKLNKKSTVEITVPCEQLKEFEGQTMKLGIEIKGSLEDGTEKKIDGDIVSKIPST